MNTAADIFPLLQRDAFSMWMRFADRLSARPPGDPIERHGWKTSLGSKSWRDGSTPEWLPSWGSLLWDTKLSACGSLICKIEKRHFTLSKVFGPFHLMPSKKYQTCPSSSSRSPSAWLVDAGRTRKTIMDPLWI